MHRKLLAEGVGTFILVFFGAGSAVFALADLGSTVGVALTFGLTLLVLVYAIGPISGCHVNPAVTVAVLLTRGMSRAEAIGYIVAQVSGASVAGLLLKLLTLSSIGGVKDNTGQLATNSWSAPVTWGGAFITEVLLTMLLVFVVLQVTSSEGIAANPGFAGLTIGSTLAVIHLVGIPVSGASVNPARSLGPALFEPSGWQYIWLYLLAPLAGAACGWAVHSALRNLSATETHTGKVKAQAESQATG